MPLTTPGSAPLTRDGERVGHYVLGEEIGRGGMGVVYRAHDPGLGRDVALKVLPAHLHRDPERVARLRAEARAASTLDHAHVCTVYEVGEPAPETGFGPLFIAMALYDGETLEARLARGPLPVGDAAAVAHQVALGLAAAHRKGIVHRDVKPSNVFLTAEGSPGGGPGPPRPCVKLLDFGVARVEGAPITRDGATLGTVEYAAPEQAHGEAGPASDQWGLGVLLYEMLAGRRPFDEPYEAALLYAVLNADPPPLAGLRPETPEGLGDVVARLLEKRPADRFETMDAAAAALAPFAAGTAPVETGRAWHAARRWVRARQGWRASRWWVAAALAVLVAAGAWSLTSRMGTGERHVAVLPLRAEGGGAAAQAFADGLTESLTTGLTQLAQYEGALWVVPASEVVAQGISSPSAARQRLGATLVATGTVQRSGGHVRVTLNLIDAVSLRQSRSATVDVPEARLNTLAAAVGAALEEMLDLELRPERRHADAGTASPEAFDALTQGVGYLDRFEDPANVDRAITLLGRAVALDPGYALAHARLGEAYTKRFLITRDARALVRAETSAREALARAPDAPATHALLARVARLRGRPAEALANARRAVALDPSSDEAMSELASAYAAAGDDVHAEQAHLRAVRAQPGAWSVYNRLGLFYLNAGRTTEATARFRDALRLAPDNSEALLNLGGALWTQGDADAARPLFERSAAIRPGAMALSNIGLLDYSAGHFDAAARAFERSLSLDPADVVVWGNLASAYDTLGRPADLRRAYTEGARRAEAQLTVTPGDTDLLATLADFYAELGQHAAARRAADRAARLSPSVYVQVALANVYATLGDADAARRWVRQAVAEGYPRDIAQDNPELRPFLSPP